MVLGTPVFTCIYTTAVECGKYSEACKRCGWNPTVDQQRKKRLREKYCYELPDTKAENDE